MSKKEKKATGKIVDEKPQDEENGIIKESTFVDSVKDESSESLKFKTGENIPKFKVKSSIREKGEKEPTKTLADWLYERKLMLLTMVPFYESEVNMKTKISEKVFNKLIKDCAVKQIS